MKKRIATFASAFGIIAAVLLGLTAPQALAVGVAAGNANCATGPELGTDEVPSPGFSSYVITGRKTKVTHTTWVTDACGIESAKAYKNVTFTRIKKSGVTTYKWKMTPGVTKTRATIMVVNPARPKYAYEVPLKASRTQIKSTDLKLVKVVVNGRTVLKRLKIVAVIVDYLDYNHPSTIFDEAYPENDGYPNF